jgi:hypothetical protein
MIVYYYQTPPNKKKNTEKEKQPAMNNLIKEERVSAPRGEDRFELYSSNI